MQQTRSHKRRPSRALVATALAMVVATSGQALSGAAARAAAPSNGSAPDAVITWNANVVKVAQTNQCLSPANHPLHEARMYAMMHVAIHDALNAIDRRARPYIAGLGHHPNASPDATVASAARNVLVPVLQSLPAGLGCVPDAVTSVENDYAGRWRPFRLGRRKPRASSWARPRRPRSSPNGAVMARTLRSPAPARPAPIPACISAPPARRSCSRPDGER